MIDELRSWADWCVSCACGGKSVEVEAAYWAIDEIARLRAENERMRESLSKLSCDQSWSGCDWVGYPFTAKHIAKEALK